MIFQYTLDLLLSGRKTQTCRIAKPSEKAIRASDGTIEAVTGSGRDKYRIGKTYAVQPSRNESAVARIHLTSIEKKKISAITLKEAQAEGYASGEEFFAVWRTIHGEKNAHAEVWVLKFELVPAN